MSQRIYKETFKPGHEELDLRLSANQKVVHFGTQDSGGFPRMNIWFTHHDTDNPPITRRFRIRGTGHAIEDDAQHLGTCFVGPYVFHLFELPTP